MDPGAARTDRRGNFFPEDPMKTALILAMAAIWTSALQAQNSDARPGPVIGAHYGAPLMWSGLLGFGVPAGSGNGEAFVAAEGGIGGWRASGGYVRIATELGNGYSIRASLLRTSKHAWNAPARSSFVGAEVQYMPLFALGARVGGFIRVGNGGSQRGLMTADFSFAL